MNLKALLASGVEYVAEFCAVSSFAGLSQIVAPKRHFAERFLWAAVVFIFGLCASLLVIRSYNRYQTNPTVISMDKNYMKWSTPLPATTFCMENKYDEDKGARFIQSTWNVTDESNKFGYYSRFLTCLSLGYNDADQINSSGCSEFSKDDNLNKFDLWNLIEMTSSSEPENVNAFTFESEDDIGLQRIKVENGLCYAINTSFLTRYFTISQTKVALTVADAKNMTKFCSYLKPACYAKIMDLLGSAKFYVHWSMDIPGLSGGISTARSTNTETGFLSQTIEATARLKDLRPAQRRCYFYDEKPTGNTPFYTYSMCLMSCRRELLLKLCGCVGYPYKPNAADKICTARDLACFYSNMDVIESLRFENRTKYQCNCLPDCSFITYYRTYTTANPAYSNNGMLANESMFRYGMDAMPRTKLIRDVLYAIEDLLVSWGGIIGIFLGCSIVSVVEAVYFFTMRLIRVVMKKMLEKKKNKEKGARRVTKDWLRPYVMGHTGRHMYEI